MSRKIKVEILGDSSSLERAFGRSAQSASRWSASITKSASRIPLILGAAAAALGTGLAVAAVKGVRAASDLGEQVNKTRVVFAASSKEILKWSKTTATSLGLSQRAALEAAGGYGAMLQTAGLAEKQSAKFSKRLVELAADMASFNNINPEEALLKLKAGLAGEAEPLRTVGVLLSAARVEAEAYASGIAKNGAVLTEGQKVQARYNLILKDTAKQQGDFARTAATSLPNAVRILKALGENAAAGLGKIFLPTIAKAATGVADFVGKLQKTRGVKAKFRVAISGLEGLGRDLFKKASDAVNAVNWADVVRQAQAGLIAGLRTVADALNSINWGEVGRRLGDAIATGMKGAADFLRSVDWSFVGETIVKGVSKFLTSVNWKALAVGLFKLLQAAVRAVAQLVIGIGRELGKQLLHGIKLGIDAGTREILRLLLKFVNKVLGLTGFLGRFDPFKGVRAKVRRQLDAMEADTRSTVTAINSSLGTLQDVDITISINTVSTFNGKSRPEEGTGVQTIAQGRARKRISDAKIAARQKAEAAAASKASAATESIAKAAAARAKKAAALAKRLAARRDKAFGEGMDALALKVDVATSRKNFTAALAGLAAEERMVRAQIKAAGRTTELSRELFRIEEDRRSVREAMASLAKDKSEKDLAALQRKQFKSLGLSGSGEEIVPGVKNLKKQFASLSDRVADSPGQVSKKLVSRLAGVRKLLAGAFGKLSEDTRAAISDLFGAIRDEFDNQDQKGPLTKTSALNSKKVLAGLGLSGDQIRELRGRLSGFNSAGIALADKAAPSGSFAGGPVVVESHTTVQLDGHTVAKSVTRNQQKRNRRNPAQRRGPNRGGV